MTEVLSQQTPTTNRDDHTEPARESFRVARVAGWWRVDVANDEQPTPARASERREVDSIPGYF